MEPTVVVVGDVHLSPEHAAAADRFEAFLDGLRADVRTLVLLGDVFDFWVGRRQALDPFERRFVEALRRVRGRGVRVAFLAGNRDYAFDGAPGLDVEIWPDVVRTRWGSRTVVLTHGDLLCSADVRYQRMRRVLRSRPARVALAALPHDASTWLARGLRDLSERETRRKPYASMGIDYGLARAWLDGYGADAIVAGHVHTGVHHRIGGGNGAPPRDVLVLRDWERGGGIVVSDAAGLRLVSP
jgi:UDP-2,3-diacylglucosamine hydrolase